MRNFRRVTIYLSAFFVGLMISIVILKKKNTKFNYLPNSRVISELKKKEMIIPSNLSKIIDTTYFKEEFWKNVDIDFSNSSTRIPNPIYILEINNDSTLIEVTLKNRKDINKVELITYKVTKK